MSLSHPLRTLFSGLVFFFAALLIAFALDVRVLLAALFVWLYAGLPLEAFLPAVRLVSYAAPVAAALDLAWSFYRNGRLRRLRYALRWRTFGAGDVVPQDLITTRGGTARFTRRAEVGMDWRGRVLIDMPSVAPGEIGIWIHNTSYVACQGFELRTGPGRTPPLTIPRTLQVVAFFALFILAALA